MLNATMSQICELLVKNKVADSYQYYRNCNELIRQLNYHYETLNKIVSRWESIDNNIISKVQIDWDYETLSDYHKRENEKNCRMSINEEKANVKFEVQGRFMLILGMMQSLLDSYAKWINTSLLAGKKTNNKKCNIGALCHKIDELGYDLDFCIEFLEKNVLEVEGTEEYLYVNSLNNIMKHQCIIEIDLCECVDGIWRIAIPKFKKQAKNKDYVYDAKNMLAMLEKSFSYFCKLVDESAEYIVKFYSDNENPFTYRRSHEVGLFNVTKGPGTIQRYFFIPESEVHKQGQTFLLIEDEHLNVHNCFMSEIMVTENNDPEKIIGKLIVKDDKAIRLQYKKATEYQIEILDMRLNDFDISYIPYMWSDNTDFPREELESMPLNCKHIIYKKI